MDLLKKSSPKTALLPIAALTIMALLFGLSFVATKYALNTIPPFTLIFLRFLIAFLLLGLFCMKRGYTAFERRDRPRIFLISLIVPGLYFLAETLGIKFSSAATVSLLVATVPIFGALFAFLLLKETISTRRGFGILLSVFGVAVILFSSPGDLSVGDLSSWGNLLGLGAAVCAGLYIALGREILARYPPLKMTAMQAFSAAVIFLPLAAVEQATHTWTAPSGLAVGAVLYLALFCSILAFFLWNFGISRMEASRASAFANLVPVFTVIGAYILLGETIQGPQITGGLLVIFGVMLASI